MSPYIFILYMEPLIRQLNEAYKHSKNHVGILSFPQGLRVSNLMFADDCLIFGKASTTAARKIVSILNLFSKASGHKINYHKSSLYFSSKVSSQTKDDIVGILHIQHKSTIGKYLGMHNIIFWKDHVNAKELLLRISNKLSGWKSNTLSRADRLTLIKSNLSGMPNHVMASFKCPSKITNALDRRIENSFGH